ncbi:MAG TPA: molybdopterin-dependent oxidoreductase, partial [Candidatus Limnocylindria bacterium]|nr:molybdopterin-dependent oxidoreductase [Candidatus Limnocylindria bacterium]
MKLFTKKADLPAETAARVPPGQYLTQKWPVLHYGPVPPWSPKTWDFRVFGNVENEFKLTWEEFQKLEQTAVQADMHCVTTWSKLDQQWEGIPFSKIVELARPKPDSKFVIAHSEYGFTANTPIEYCLRDDCLIALRANGAPLTAEHG